AIIANSLLLFCMFRNMSSSFANFGILMKTHAFFDLYTAIGGFMTMLRTIPIGWSVINISYGPCRFTCPLVCYIFYVVVVGGSLFTFYIVLGSFYFRLRLIRDSAPTRMHTILILIFISFPLPTILTARFHRTIRHF
ncbi:hypothetical protein PFISCL1PPCAC_6992, partial [Pristionchus fissidentatus]